MRHLAKYCFGSADNSYYMLALAMQQVHELLACLCLVEGAAEVARGGDGCLLLHPAHLHAHVFCLYHYHHSEWMEGVLDAVLYLLCQTLLYLKSMTVDVNHPCATCTLP